MNLKDKKNRQFEFTIIGFGLALAAMLYMTILTGHRQEWFRMGFYLFFVLYIAELLIGTVVDMNIFNRFKRLESIISGKSDSTQLKFQPSFWLILIVFTMFVAVMFLFLFHAAYCRDWIVLCTYLSVFAIGIFIFRGIKLTLDIKIYAKCLVKLIRKEKDSKGSTKISPKQDIEKLNLMYKQGRMFFFGLIALGVAIMMNLCLTLITWRREDWYRMGLFLFQFLFASYLYIGLAVQMNIYSNFKRLEGIISDESDTSQLKRQTLPMLIVIIYVVFIGVMTFFSMLAATRKEWVILCIYLTVFAIVNFISMGVDITLNIKNYTKHIEELIYSDMNHKKIETVGDHSTG